MTTFGATCIPQVPPERLRQVARTAEAEGLDELWFWEDCFWGGGIATAVLDDACPEDLCVLPVTVSRPFSVTIDAARLTRGLPLSRGHSRGQ